MMDHQRHFITTDPALSITRRRPRSLKVKLLPNQNHAIAYPQRPLEAIPDVDSRGAFVTSADVGQATSKQQNDNAENSDNSSSSSSYRSVYHRMKPLDIFGLLAKDHPVFALPPSKLSDAERQNRLSVVYDSMSFRDKAVIDRMSGGMTHQEALSHVFEASELLRFEVQRQKSRSAAEKSEPSTTANADNANSEIEIVTAASSSLIEQQQVQSIDQNAENELSGVELYERFTRKAFKHPSDVSRDERLASLGMMWSEANKFTVAALAREMKKAQTAADAALGAEIVRKLPSSSPTNVPFTIPPKTSSGRTATTPSRPSRQLVRKAVASFGVLRSKPDATKEAQKAVHAARKALPHTASPEGEVPEAEALVTESDVVEGVTEHKTRRRPRKKSTRKYTRKTEKAGEEQTKKALLLPPLRLLVPFDASRDEIMDFSEPITGAALEAVRAKRKKPTADFVECKICRTNGCRPQIFCKGSTGFYKHFDEFHREGRSVDEEDLHARKKDFRETIRYQQIKTYLERKRQRCKSARLVLKRLTPAEVKEGIEAMKKADALFRRKIILSSLPDLRPEVEHHGLVLKNLKARYFEHLPQPKSTLRTVLKNARKKPRRGRRPLSESKLPPPSGEDFYRCRACHKFREFANGRNSELKVNGSQAIFVGAQPVLYDAHEIDGTASVEPLIEHLRKYHFSYAASVKSKAEASRLPAKGKSRKDTSKLPKTANLAKRCNKQAGRKMTMKKAFGKKSAKGRS